ncbi:T9SS type A sorting domain-containing protein [Acetobacteroides hydrogenigenes]|uniref:Putative secreted protein (Por secretion system target) n=1 Tax=Acetobacteroides hydrogenigenes TaxID=979970 RepID=A0A4R2EZ58_9BACT|nr:T9SS type A sorting domain-containing protein [Acetobacteroides hydrogenigenes]TCN73247.1 putative secreted protein (Por secretion system target) [Acetobacteroides hydrogenigenes]
MKAFFWRTLLACLFGLTLTTPSMGQPLVYSNYEVGKLREFLNQPSAVAGKTNGKQVNAAYNPDDPSTFGVTWTSWANSDRQVSSIDWNWKSLAGNLSFSNFTLLESLWVIGNQFTTANVSGCTKLNRLEASANQLTSLDVSGCSQLSMLICGNNKLTSLNVSSLTKLTTLDVRNNSLKELVLSSNTLLSELECGDNQLTRLDVSGCSQLSRLSCERNMLSSLNVGSLTKLTYIQVHFNLLKELDLSSNTLLSSLDCSSNQFMFSTLPIKSNLTYYRYSPQALITIGKDITVNGFTFKHVGVDEVIDLSTEASINGKSTTFVWKKRRDGSEVKPTNSAGAKFTFDASLEKETIYCEMRNDAFPNSTVNDCLKTVDVAIGNSFDIYNAYEVGKLRAFLNQPSAIAGKTNGQQVNAAYNPNDPSTFGVTWTWPAVGKRVNNINWTSKSLSGDLDLSNFIDLGWFYISFNQLKTANFSGCTNLQSLWLENNQLTSIDVSGCRWINQFRCQNNKLTSLDVSSLTKLATLDAYSNSLVELNLGSNMRLSELRCANNQLTSLEVSGCSQLLSFGCNNNKLTSLNIGSLTKLTSLDVQNNLLKELDLSTNTLLSSLNCSNNQFEFSSLPVKSSLTTYNYSPQALIAIGNDLTVNGSTFKHVGVNESIDLSSEATIEGKNTIFVWKKRSDGSEVKPTNSAGAKFTFDASLAKETIYCEMRNDAFPKFTGNDCLKTVDVTVGNSFDTYNAYEVGKLRAFLDQPSAVAGKTNGLQVNAAYNPNDPSTFGVTWTKAAYEKRVEGISWQLKSLSGDLNFSNFAQLGWIYVNGGLLKTVNVSGCTMLRDLWVSNNQLTRVEVSGCSQLYRILCDYNKLTFLNVGSLTKLKYINTYNNSLKELDFSSNTLLSELQCGNNQLTSIVVSGCSQLSLIECQNNKLASLNVGSLTKLATLNANNNLLKELNLSSNTLLRSLDCGNNQLRLSTLPVKQNLTNYTYVPQGLISIGKDIVVSGKTFKYVGVDEMVDLSAEATIGGKPTTFAWKKRRDGAVVTPTTSNGGMFTFGASLAGEVIYCEMSNANFPYFTGDVAFKTVDVVVGNTFNIYNTYEVGKLQAFLNQSSSEIGKSNGQLLNSNYNANDPSTFWVTWSNSPVEKKVISIYWSGLGVTGSLDLSNFAELSQLRIANNYLSNVNIAGANKLSSMSCTGNYLKFSTLHLGSPSLASPCSYAPQRTLSIGRDTTINGYNQRYIETYKEVNLSSEQTVGGKPTIYTWRKSSDKTVVTPLKSENGVFVFSENLAGQMIYCELTNAAFPDFAGQNVLSTETVRVEGRYNSNDVAKLKSFLQQESAISGQKNYQRIGLEVDINDPSSWPLVVWTASSTNKRVESISWMRKDLAGNLDFSGLDNLKSVELTTNKIASADFSGCSKLEKIWLDENTITAINTSTLASLKRINVNYNKITQLDLSANVKLEEAEFASNLLSTVKLPNTATLGLVRATRNNFKLSTLSPALSQYYSYFYQPQNPMVIGDAVQENDKTIYKVGSYTTIDLSSELTIGGKTTNYSWYNVSKKTDITPRTSANGKFSFDSSVEGDTLICYMRNESLPDFSMLYPFETVKVLVASGYNQYEVGKLKAFLDQPSALEGKTNGQVVNPTYNSNDPSTFGITWTGAAIEKRAASISWWGKNLSGDLDFSNFSQLSGLTISYSQLKTANLSSCVLLSTLQLDNNKLINVDVSGCSQLSWFSCQSNKLASLNVGSLTKLTTLITQGNSLKVLDLSSNTLLRSLYCGDNLLKFSTLPVKSSLTTYAYVPQGVISIGEDITVNGTTFKHVGLGKAIDLSAEATIDGKATTFVWKMRRDGSVITPTTSEGGIFTFDASLANQTIYCEMSNATFPSFTGNNTLKTVDVVVGDSFVAYNAYEVGKLKAFLDQPSAVAGKTNGQQVNSAYNSEDPSTYGVVWNSNLFDKKVTLIDWQSKSLSGSIALNKFSELVTFYLGDNGISNVDMSECAKLEGLHFERNQVATLNVSGCSNLYLLVCDNNRLTNVDLSQAPNLVSFNAMRNKLTVVDFSANPKLQSIGLRGNQIGNVEVNSLTQLKQLVVGENKIANLNLSNLSNLEVLWGDNNNLRLLDIAANTKLTSLYCYNNSFTYSTLPGKPASVTAFGCAPQKLVEIGEKQISGTSEKYFIGADHVVDLGKENIVNGVQTTFTWKEQYGSVVTPTSSNGGKFTFNSKFVGKKLYCEMANAGFPDFVGYNILKTVVVEVVPAYNQNDVDKLKAFLNKPSQESGKTNGQQLNAAYNPEDPATYGVAWSRHNVNKRVISFQWYDKKLSGDLDLSGCELLNDVFISNNKIPSVNFKGCSSLVNLYAESNEIASASFDKHPLLESVDISLNKLTSLTIPEAPMLSFLFATDNKLSQIDLSKMASLTRVKLMRNELSSMDVSDLTKLQMLKVEGNKITGVKFGGNEQLVLLNLDSNQLLSVDVSSLTSLTDLTLSNNKLLLSRLPLGKAAYTNYSYAPQSSMAVGHAKQEGNDVKYSIYAEEPLDLSSELNVGGNVTAFVWKKADGTVVLPTSSDNGVFAFSTGLIGETLYGELSNASFPDFAGDKVFKTVKFTVLSPYNEEEVSKLIGFFGRPSMNGINNGDCIGISKMNDPSSWRGVEWTSGVSDRRVKSISWASLGIADTLNIFNFVKLTSIDVADNKLDKIISANTPLLKRGLFGSNQLKFSTMPTSTSFDEYSCFPQAKLEIGKKAESGSYTLMAGEYVDLSSEVTVEGQATNFTWKDEAGNTITPTKGENGRFAFNSDFIGRKLYCGLSNSKFPNGSIQTVIIAIPGSKFESKFGKEVNIAVYPNPASSILKVEIDEVIREYRIYSVSGVLMKSGTINDFKAEIKVETLTSGTYLLELTDGAKVYRSKFIKQ